MDMDKKINDKLKRKHGMCSCLWTGFAGLLLMGCGEDTPAPDKVSPNGKQVVVDYTVGEARTRSVSHDALPAHERIKSLVYLLYDDEGSLLKRREIPGVASMKDGDWPMTRATMTWAQREALKDTLQQGHSYTAVFVANADPSLFGGEEVLHITATEDGEEVPAALDDVYLSLPAATAFGDNNMFYLSVNNIEPDGYDRDTHCDCPVTLQRIVSRTDFFSDDYPAWDTDFTRGKVRAFTDSKVYGALLPVATSENPLKANDWLKSFTTDFYKFTYAYTLIPTEGVVYAAWLSDFAVKVNGLDCTGSINNSISTTEETDIKNMLYESCLRNGTLKGLWQPWKGLQAKVAYSSRADRFYVSGKTSKAGDAAEALSPFLDVVQKEATATDGSSVTQNTFTLIGFGENADAAAGSELNKMTAVQLYESATATSPVATISMTDNVQSFAAQGGNERVQLEYCPIKTLKYNTDFTTGLTYSLPPVNLEELLPGSLTTSSVYMGRLQDFFDSEDGGKYGTGLDNFILRITLPDLSDASALTVTPEWSVK